MDGYDIVIVGSGIMGASVAWHLAEAGSDASIAVIERDPTFARAGSTATNSCLRQQFTTAVNIQASLYTAQIIRDFPAHARDPEAPRIALDPFGYLYLAVDHDAADALRSAQALQASLGAGTVMMDGAALAKRFAFIRTDDVVLASWGSRDEGYFDGHGLWEYWRRAAPRRGVTFLTGEVVDILARQRAVG